MADPLLYIGATGVVGLITAWATHQMTRTTNRDSAEREAKRRVEEEQRQAKRRVEEEQRQAIRQNREKRAQPVVDFLELSKRRFASRAVGGAVAKAVEELPPKVKANMDSQELEQLKRRATGYEPDHYELVRLYIVAVASSFSIPALRDELDKIHDAQGLNADPETARQWGPAIASAEALIERYIVSAEPHESSADTQE